MKGLQSTVWDLKFLKGVKRLLLAPRVFLYYPPCHSVDKQRLALPEKMGGRDQISTSQSPKVNYVEAE